MSNSDSFNQGLLCMHVYATLLTLYVHVCELSLQHYGLTAANRPVSVRRTSSVCLSLNSLALLQKHICLFSSVHEIFSLSISSSSLTYCRCVLRMQHPPNSTYHII
ncbi:hypothetical protein ATANTOWER_031520 [Ataeniobius toweri]|uniref:Secreted protein n=1 Tax=Ataeniobius toweri TaxID=208326 RepID=A0ABU7AVJ7_9TELE|nr:hypothetical protein [Ataeniobius toweri]